MKKIVTLLLVLTLVFVFVASCDNGSKSNEPAASKQPPPKEIGMYDPNYDYNANPRYKVVYIVSSNTSGLYTASSYAFAHWASVMNIDFQGMLDFAGDDDALMSQLPQLARDHDGLLMDASATTYDRVAEIMQETGTPWMSFMAAPRDYSIDTTPLLNTYVGFDQVDVGKYFADYLVDKAKATWPGVPLSEFGFITVDFSTAPPLHEREMGCHARLLEIEPDLATNRYFVADTSINFFDAVTSQQVVSAVLSMNPEIKRWIIFAEIDDMAQGAAAALDLMGYTDDSWVSAFGGTALHNQWDAGSQDAWKSAIYLPQTIFTEPVICALYAYMNGDATPETIFPEWKNVHEDTSHGSFATRMLPFYEILYDNYKHMLKWSDIYSGANFFPDYPSEGITRDSYSNTVPIPASYK